MIDKAVKLTFAKREVPKKRADVRALLMRLSCLGGDGGMSGRLRLGVGLVEVLMLWWGGLAW